MVRAQKVGKIRRDCGFWTPAYALHPSVAIVGALCGLLEETKDGWITGRLASGGEGSIDRQHWQTRERNVG